MASGSSNAQLKKRCPGKRQAVVSQAVLTPILITPTATPSNNRIELRMYSGTTVAHKWLRVVVSVLPNSCNTDQPITSNGTPITTAVNTKVNWRHRLNRINASQLGSLI